jgi:sugar phosphate isomerase/epimerase
MLGISTCWWENRALNGQDIIHEILDLGLNGVELEYRIPNTLFRQMMPLLNKTVQVLSIHNYFPRLEEFGDAKPSGDMFLLSSIDKDERSRAIQYTIKTMEHASDLEVMPVILHLGHVDMSNPFDQFNDLYSKGTLNSEAGHFFVQEQRKARAGRIQNHLDAVLFSLDRLNNEAVKKGVLLCIENRYHFHEIPDFKEIGTILNAFKGGNVRYWHDMGHAAVQEKMGLAIQKEFLKTYSKDMVGVHIHDVTELDDHLPPGKGDMNYQEFTPMIKSAAIHILEIDSKTNREDLKEGIAFIQKETGTNS